MRFLILLLLACVGLAAQDITQIPGPTLPVDGLVKTGELATFSAAEFRPADRMDVFWSGSDAFLRIDVSKLEDAVQDAQVRGLKIQNYRLDPYVEDGKLRLRLVETEE